MSTKTLTTTLALVLAAGTALAAGDVLPAAGTTFTPYGAVEGWNIFVNEDRKNCMIESVDGNENVVQMGMTGVAGVGYVGAFTKADIDLEPGQEGVAILIGDNLYMGTARRLTTSLRDGYKGAYVVSDDPQFMKDVMEQYQMIVLPESDAPLIISLEGTMKAIEAAMECTAAQRN